MFALLPLFLAILLGVDAQECSIKAAENATILRISELESQPMVNIIDLQHNCFATSERLGAYYSISLSVRYSRTNSAIVKVARHNWLCQNDAWLLHHENTSSSSYFNETRSDCHACIDRTANDHYCTR